MYGDCTNRTRPCRVHDERSEWHIEIRSRTVHVGWLIALVVVIGFVTTLPWFLQGPGLT